MNPFEIRFKPLIEDIKSGKRELERRGAVASHECMLFNPNFSPSKLTSVVQIEIDRMTKGNN